MRQSRIPARALPAQLILALTVAFFAAACSDHEIKDRPQIALFLGAEGLDRPVVPFGFVGADDQRTVSLLVQNLGTEPLVLEVPELLPMNWTWAAMRGSRATYERSLWPLERLTIGSVEYNADQLFAVLGNDGSRDPSAILGAAYVRARLTVEAGGNRNTIDRELRAAETWFDAQSDGSRLPYRTDAAGAAGAEAAGLAESLNTYAGGRNRDVTFDPARRYSAGDFPLVIAPGGERALQFQYAPKEPRDGRPVMIRLQSNDGFGNEDLRFMVQMTERTALLRSVPTMGIFVNPSYSAPGFETFRIENDGTDELIVTSIALQHPTREGYELIPPTKPLVEWIVPPFQAGNLDPLQFSVRYAPLGDPEPNAVIITSNSSGQETYTIPLQVELQERAEFEMNYQGEAEGYMNFIGEPHGTERKVNLRNLGPSNFVLERAVMEPTPAALSYEVVVQTPPTTPGGEPRVYEGRVSLAAGRTLEIIVRFVGDPDAPVNGALRLDYRNPNDFASLTIPVFGGETVPQITFGPASARLAFTAAVGSGATNTLVIGNTGNAPLTIHGIDVFDQHFQGGDCDTEPAASEHFALGAGAPEEVDLPPFSLREVGLRFSPQSDHTQLLGYAQVRYDDPLASDPSERCKTLAVTLVGSTSTAATRPQGRIDVLTPDPQVGRHLVFDGAGSDPGDGVPFADGYSWFIGRKPQGSKAFFRQEGASRAQFVPDFPGTYRMYMSLFSQGDGGTPLYSDLTFVEVEVAPATAE